MTGIRRIFRKMSSAANTITVFGREDPRHQLPRLPGSEKELDELLKDRREPDEYQGVTRMFRRVFFRNKEG